jgi:hypothetical protein
MLAPAVFASGFRNRFSTEVLDRGSRQRFSTEVLDRGSRQRFSTEVLDRGSRQRFSTEVLERGLRERYTTNITITLLQQGSQKRLRENIKKEAKYPPFRTTLLNNYKLTKT